MLFKPRNKVLAFEDTYTIFLELTSSIIYSPPDVLTPTKCLIAGVCVPKPECKHLPSTIVWASRNQLLSPSSAYSAFSEEKNCLVFCNLYDGFTICTFSPYFFDTEVLPIENTDNIPLPVRIIHGGNDILTGSPLGQVLVAPLARLTSTPHSTYLSHNSQ